MTRNTSPVDTTTYVVERPTKFRNQIGRLTKKKDPVKSDSNRGPTFRRPTWRGSVDLTKLFLSVVVMMNRKEKIAWSYQKGKWKIQLMRTKQDCMWSITAMIPYRRSNTTILKDTYTLSWRWPSKVSNNVPKSHQTYIQMQPGRLRMRRSSVCVLSPVRKCLLIDRPNSTHGTPHVVHFPLSAAL